jgi:hypothetical protein
LPLKRQNPIQALQPSLPEAPLWANVVERQSESVRDIESGLRSLGDIEHTLPREFGSHLIDVLKETQFVHK